MIAQGVGQGGQVDVLQLAADRHPARKPGDDQRRAAGARHGAQRLCQHMGGGLALGRETSGQDHLLHHAVGCPLQQRVHADVAQADAVERAEPAHQHEVQAPVAAAALHGRLVGRAFDHQQLARIALRVAAGGAQRFFGEGVAAGAMPHRHGRRLQRLRQALGAIAVVLQQVVGHALGRLLPHAGQAAQRVDQAFEAALGHPQRPVTTAPGRGRSSGRRGTALAGPQAQREVKTGTSCPGCWACRR